MKRGSFLLAGAGATLAGCANAALPPNGNAGASPQQQRPAWAEGAQLLGSLLLVPYDFVVREYAACDGSLIPIRSNTPLFSLLDTRFGGDGVWTFGLPDMRGKEPLKGLSYQIAIEGSYPHRYGAGGRILFGIPLLGQLLLVPYVRANLPPRGWAVCDGTTLNVGTNRALFSLVANKFGGDGKSTFALPDLRDRVPHNHLTYLIALEGRMPQIA